VHVAELAGVPAPVVRRAATLMAAMEKQGGPLAASTSLRALPLFAAASPPPNAAVEEATAEDRRSEDVSALCAALHDMQPDSMSPKQALEALYHLKTLALPCASGSIPYD
jgi:DNA mismatch repair protein MutS